MSKSRDLAKVINSDGGITLRGNTLFESDNAFDIGSAEFKIRDLFVSENSLWVGDEHKLSIDSTTGKFKARKRKKGKIPKKLRDRLVGSGKMFDTEALMLADFKSKYFTGVSNQEDKNNPDHADFNPNTKKWVRFLNDLEIKKDDGSNEDYETPEDVMDDDEDFDEDRDDDKVESTQTATSSTLGLVKIGYTKSGYNYPVELSGDKMYVNVPWVDTQVTVTNAYTSTSTSSALSANKGKELKDLVDGKAASSHSHSGYASSSHTHTQGDYDVGDNVKLKLGASDDLQMYHDGSNSYINSWNGGFGAGALILIGGESSNDYSSAGISLRPTSSATKRGYVEIYPDGDGSWFDQGGMLVFKGGQDSDAAGTVYHPDAKIYLGDTNAGQTAGAEDLVIETGGTSFNAGSIILRTNGVDVSVNNGAITATSFTGDGSALTNLPSSGGSGGVSTGKAIAMAIVFG